MRLQQRFGEVGPMLWVGKKNLTNHCCLFPLPSFHYRLNHISLPLKKAPEVTLKERPCLRAVFSHTGLETGMEIGCLGLFPRSSGAPENSESGYSFQSRNWALPYFCPGDKRGWSSLLFPCLMYLLQKRSFFLDKSKPPLIFWASRA